MEGDFPFDLPELLEEETLDSQEEYPQEAVEEVVGEAEGATQECRLQQHHNKQTTRETN